jgi:hypothetical protein
MDGYLGINGKYYAVDMDKVTEFVQGTGNSVVQSINQTYGMVGDDVDSADFKLIQKEVTETKDSLDTTMCGYRYNIITNMLGLALASFTDVGDDTIQVVNQFDMYGAGQKMAFNTLLGMGIIYEIETEE